MLWARRHPGDRVLPGFASLRSYGRLRPPLALSRKIRGEAPRRQGSGPRDLCGLLPDLPRSQSLACADRVPLRAGRP